MEFSVLAIFYVGFSVFALKNFGFSVLLSVAVSDFSDFGDRWAFWVFPMQKEIKVTFLLLQACLLEIYPFSKI